MMAESEVEEAVLDILKELDYSVALGPDIASDGTAPERTTYSDVILIERTRDAVDGLNSKIPKEAREEAVRKLLRTESHLLIQNNKAFHKMLVDGVNVEYKRRDGSIAGTMFAFLIFKTLKTTNS
jgi:type I restriction enzyme R subunit